MYKSAKIHILWFRSHEPQVEAANMYADTGRRMSEKVGSRVNCFTFYISEMYSLKFHLVAPIPHRTVNIF